MGRALAGFPRQEIAELLVGFEDADDAGVYLVAEDLALVQTVDFFSPIVDDPFTYGQIAAANALSDVYAMGGRPITALSIVGFPADGIEPDVLRTIMEGGIEKLNECGVALLGGHSVRDEEVKFGYAVTGTVKPAEIRQNNAGTAGDRILLTKPLGTGLITTALKKEAADPAHVAAAVRVMVETNGVASETASRFQVRAMTDVTGFGLVGHAVEIARASHLTLTFDPKRLPQIEGARTYSQRGFCAGGLHSNREFFSGDVSWEEETPEDVQNLVFDPQTSGGLLILAPVAVADALTAALVAEGVDAVEVGIAQRFDSKLIRFRRL